MAGAKNVSVSQWLLLPCLLTTVAALAGMLFLSGSVPSETRLFREFKHRPEYQPMRDNLSDAELLRKAAGSVAVDAARPGKPRVAFLFIVRGDIPHEPLWRRFFAAHDDEYSLYAHAEPGYRYAQGSLLAGREVPSQPCPRFSRGIVDALRRLLAHALLDPRYHNAWFVNLCESAVPIRSFDFTYQYLTTSSVSFVESFYPVARYLRWEPLPQFNRTELRKGELWMALRRDHAAVVVRDADIYGRFDEKCNKRSMCTWDEQYVQTLLHLRDAQGIATRTVMYVNWTQPHGGTPKVLQSTAAVVQDVRARTWDGDGERHDTAWDNSTFACEHNGVAPAPCFLFARKFAAGATRPLLQLASSQMGY